MKIVKIIFLLCVSVLSSKIRKPKSQAHKYQNYLECSLVHFDYKAPIASRSAGERSMISTMQFLNCINIYGLEQTNDEPVTFLEYLRAFQKIFKLRQMFRTERYLILKSPELFWLCSVILFGTNVKFVYYSTDIFYRRLQSEETTNGLNFNKRARLWIYEKFEPKIWSAVTTVFTNRIDEGAIISNFSADVRLIPTRVVEYKNIHTVNNSPAVSFIFVGSAGNEPNIASLKYFLDEICEPLRLEGIDITLKVCGGGWCKLRHNFLNKTYTKLLGRISDAELEILYTKTDFAVGYMKFGAGIKGKVIEAMEFGVPVICNSIGSEGLPAEVLKPMESYTEIKNFIDMCKSDVNFYNALKSDYEEFLSTYYSREKFLISLQGKK